MFPVKRRWGNAGRTAVLQGTSYRAAVDGPADYADGHASASVSRETSSLVKVVHPERLLALTSRSPTIHVKLHSTWA